MKPQHLNHEDAVALDRICKIIPGYSGHIQQGFFKMLLADPKINNILMLGVYHGRDLAIIMDLARRWRPHVPTYVWGVDKFSNDSCADWPEDKKLMSWTQAGFGNPPAGVAQVKKNLAQAVGPLPDGHGFTAIESDDGEFLSLHTRSASAVKFDAVYLDTDHLEKTIYRQVLQSEKVMRQGGIICGDDYSNDGTWGVKRAVDTYFDYWLQVLAIHGSHFIAMRESLSVGWAARPRD